MSEKKILISVSEYKNLKTIEEKYHQTLGMFNSVPNIIITNSTCYTLLAIESFFCFSENSTPSTSGNNPSGSGSGSSTDTKQEGFGLNPDFISRITAIVTEQLSKQQEGFNKVQSRPIVSKTQNYEYSSTPLVSTNVVPSKTTPPVVFDTQIFENIQDDPFDQNRLLKRVPVKLQANAKNLLKALDERPDELTWDSTGNIFINQNAIPSADMFNIFPRLFKKQHPKRMKGFQDVVQKLKSMGLAHLIQTPSTPKIKQEGEGNTKSEKIGDIQWWYIGD